MERQIHAIPAAPGLAVGRVTWVRKASQGNRLPARIAFNAVDVEVSRFRDAAATAREQIAQLRETTAKQIGEAEASVFDAHLAFLADPAYIDEIIARVGRDLVSAEAVSTAVTREKRHAVGATG